MIRLYCLLIGYAFGCFQTAYIVTKINTGKDIRDMGSGNAGTTNVTRSVGIKPALITFFADLIKTILAALVCRFIFKDESMVLLGTYAGAGAVLGHNYPFWLKFKGGKGVAVTLAWTFMVDWRVGLLTVALSLTVLFATGYLAFNAISLSVFFPLSLMIFGLVDGKVNYECIAIIILFGVIMIVKHRKNFQRLKNHEEKKIYQIISEKRKKE
ncbi:MAG: glycerol-3-phosphate acyltransferase [Clostridiales bacterium]|nr:glycerol-3-phosphate acyltransferase [Clostridiales bacterium]